MYEFWHDCLKPKYGENVKLCYMDKDSFIAYVKTDDIYKNVADVEKKIDTLNYQIDRPLPKGKNKKVIWLMRDESAGDLMKEIYRLRAKPYKRKH